MAQNQPRIFVTRRLPEAIEARMATLFDVRFNDQDVPLSADEMLEGLEGREVMVSSINDRIDRALLGRFPRSVRLIAQFGNGFDNIDIEAAYAAAGIPVVSNASANRWTEDVPMLIPEVNASHVDIIPAQRKNRGWDKGFIAVKPNCSVQSYMTPLYALMQAGIEIKRMFVTTLQAVSGAGYPGVPSLDMIDNIVPFIGGEEEKSEKEPLKIFGRVEGGKIVNADSPLVAAHCNRVAVIDGHTACVSVEFGAKKPSVDEVKALWRAFRSVPQELKLPFAPVQPIIIREEDNRPQPRKDRDSDKGMAVTVGRIRPCPLFDLRFVGLSHNTVRGAAGGGILNAELLKARGYLG